MTPQKKSLRRIWSGDSQKINIALKNYIASVISIKKKARVIYPKDLKVILLCSWKSEDFSLILDQLLFPDVFKFYCLENSY